MHSIAFSDLNTLSIVFKALGSDDAVAHQDEEGAWFLDVPVELAGEADALAASPPVPPSPPLPTFSFLEFLDLFTGDEQSAIAGAAMVDVATKLWYDRAVGAQYIDLCDPRLAEGLQALVDDELISEHRRDCVLQGQPPGA